MAADNTDLLALMGDIPRAVDRQTEENTRNIDALRNEMRNEMREGFSEMRQATQESTLRVEAIFDRFATAVADGFIRMEKKIDGVIEEVTGVKREVTELRTDVQRIDQRLERLETNPPATPDVLRRLEILENIVLRKAS